MGARNKLLFEKSPLNLSLYFQGIQMTKQFLDAKQRLVKLKLSKKQDREGINWTKPPINVVKLNVDGVVATNRNVSAAEGLLRSSTGLLRVFTVHLGYCSPLFVMGNDVWIGNGMEEGIPAGTIGVGRLQLKSLGILNSGRAVNKL